MTDEAAPAEERASTTEKERSRNPKGDTSVSTDRVDKPISKEQKNNSRGIEEQPISKDTKDLLQGIAKGITSISSELGAIRRIIEMDKAVHGNKNIFSKDIGTAA
jgi:hypothetical protein